VGNRSRREHEQDARCRQTQIPLHCGTLSQRSTPAINPKR
jgi:hypothetical protein